MDPIKINVNVQVGVTEELYSLLCNLLPGTRQTNVPEPAAQPRESKTDEAQQPAEVTNQTPEPQAEPEPAKEAEPAVEKQFTEVDVRAAMERTRKRIEGEDYKENTDGERYKKYHRRLTAEFKNIAALLGSDKPSALPTPDLRASFIAQCDCLALDSQGNITTQIPF